MNSPGMKTWFITLPIAAAASAYVWWDFVPETRKIHELRQSMRRELDLIDTAPQIEARLQLAMTRCSEAETYVQQHEPIAGDPAQIASMMRRLAEMAKDAGVQTTRFVPEPSTKLASLQCLRVRLGCRGTLTEVCKLLAQIDAMAGEVWVDELSIEASGDPGLVQSELTLAIFADNPESSG
ncbi:MAG TPA: GspMb/PilO family protein [Pirellulales bacterium]|nr:GspMb/PilO family protein [Pirellulales bacterium]